MNLSLSDLKTEPVVKGSPDGKLPKVQNVTGNLHQEKEVIFKGQNEKKEPIDDDNKTHVSHGDVSKISEAEIEKIPISELLPDMVKVFITNMAANMDSATAAALSTKLKNQIDTVSYSNLLAREIEACGGRPLKDEETGSVVLMYFRSLLCCGGKVFVRFVLSCCKYDVSDTEGDSEIKSLELKDKKAMLEARKPDESALIAQKEFDAAKKKNDLMAVWRKAYEEDTSPDRSAHFVTSEQHKSMLLELDLEMNTINMNYYERKLKSLEEYKLTIAPAVLRVEKEILQNEMHSKRLKRVMAITSALEHIYQICLGKIREAVALKPSIIGVLRGSYSVPHVPERIVNPYDSNNLGGIYYALESVYGKPTLRNAMEEFFNVSNVKRTEEEVAGINIVSVYDAQVAVHMRWERKSLYSFMSPDVMQTLFFIGSLPDSGVKHEIAKELMQFVHSKDFNPNVEMAMFDFVGEYCRKIIPGALLNKMTISTTDLSAVDAKKKQPSSAAVPKASQSKGQSSGKLVPGAVDAYKAEITKPLPAEKFPKGMEVTREMGYERLGPRNEVMQYTATKLPCVPCMSGTMCVAGAKRTCFYKACALCKLFGHSAPFCHHKV